MSELPEKIQIVRAKDIMQWYGYSRNKAFDLIRTCKKLFGINHKEAFIPFDVWSDFLHCRLPEKSSENQAEISQKSAKNQPKISRKSS